MNAPRPAPVRTALVPGRAPGVRIETLAVGRDDDHQVRSLSAPDTYTRWVTARAVFTGDAVLLADGAGRRLDTTVDDTGAFAIGEGRIIGIVDPDDDEQPSLWLSWELATMRVGPGVGAGALRRRPIRLCGPGVELVLLGVAQVFDDHVEPRRDTHFLDALARVSA